MDMVIVSVRQRDGGLVWSGRKDRDAADFPAFRDKLEANLAQGWSITIIPEDELED